jgi:hypothetical protein
MDHSEVSVLGCKGSVCGTGGVAGAPGAVNSNGKAQGGSFTDSAPTEPPQTHSFSGNLSSGNGHFTATAGGVTTTTCSGRSALDCS